MRIKHALVAALSSLIGCGDNIDRNLPPELVSAQDRIVVTTSEDGTVTIDATAIDPEGKDVTYSAADPQHGSLSGEGPTYAYAPEANFSGSDALTISISDGENTVEIPVMITISAVNDAPVADAMQAYTAADVPVAITLHGSDAEGTDLSYSVAAAPAHGTLSGSGADLTYTPEPGYHGPDSFTFEASDGDASSAPASVAITVTMCGDGNLEGGEACDDGNTAEDDGCGRTCAVEFCGDGLVQFNLGETCDDGNQIAGDGCDAQCHVDPFVTVAPVKISADLSCTTAVANAARKVAVDGSGTVYAVMRCGTTAQVVASTDRGTSYSAPVDLSADLPNGPVTISQVAVASGPLGVAYVAMMLNTGLVYLRTTHDRGATWSSATEIGQAASTSAGLSLQSFNDDVYIGFSKSGGVNVARNHARGVGGFEVTPVNMSIVFFDLLYDPVQRMLVVAADTPTFHIRSSSDGGASFANEVNPPGSEFYSDWAIGNGTIYSSGTSGGNSALLYTVSTTSLAASGSVSGLPIVSAAQSRSVAADTAGNAFVASQLNGGGIQLDRLAFGGTAFDTARPISASPNSAAPIATPLPGGQGAAVVYTDGSSVYATIQAY